ncbi:hypothetical protein BU17DRAFT_62659 [Hysterangium stoloniferum]|nr:hypothetical protein BU17DRAFT_62659 [Hysterangium stoloniferum]
MAMGIDDDIRWSQLKPKHLCITLFAMSGIVPRVLYDPLPNSLTHLILGLNHSMTEVLFHFFRLETITHMSITVIHSSEFPFSATSPTFPPRLKAVVFPVNPDDVTAQAFEQFLDGLDGRPQLQVIGLSTYKVTLDCINVFYTLIKHSTAVLTHRNASRVVTMPLEDITPSKWYGSLQPGGTESVWDKARRLLEEKQESVVKINM